MRLESHVLSSACRSRAGDGRQSNLPSVAELSNRPFSAIGFVVVIGEGVDSLVSRQGNQGQPRGPERMISSSTRHLPRCGFFYQNPTPPGL